MLPVDCELTLTRDFTAPKHLSNQVERRQSRYTINGQIAYFAWRKFEPLQQGDVSATQLDT